MSKEIKDYEAVPGFQEVPPAEFQFYVETLGPVAWVFDWDAFWSSVTVTVPTLAKLAFTYKDIVISSADAEDYNSIYKIVLGARRRSLQEHKIKAMVFLHFKSARMWFSKVFCVIIYFQHWQRQSNQWWRCNDGAVNDEQFFISEDEDADIHFESDWLSLMTSWC